MEETSNDSNKMVNRDANGRLLPGSVLNPIGKKAGTKDYATLADEALKVLATLNGLTPEEIEAKMVANGYSQALKNDYRFYKDVLDRKYGQAKNVNDLNVSGSLTIEISEDIANKYSDIAQNTKTDSTGQNTV